MKRNGFTLAEVLITLTIIGVVAALSLPSLQNSIAKTRQEVAIKKAYNTVTQAVALYMADQQVSDLTETPLYNNKDGLKEFVNNYFRVEQDCDGRYNTSTKECFARTLWSMDKSKSSDLRSHQCMITVVLSDGMAMCFDSGVSEAITDKDENGNDYEVTSSGGVATQARALYVEVDTNGKTGPNMGARDFFYMDVNSRGRVYDSEFVANTKTCEWYEAMKSEPAPLGIGMIQADGWKMKY